MTLAYGMDKGACTEVAPKKLKISFTSRWPDKTY